MNYFFTFGVDEKSTQSNRSCEQKWNFEREFRSNFRCRRKWSNLLHSGSKTHNISISGRRQTSDQKDVNAFTKVATKLLLWKWYPYPEDFQNYNYIIITSLLLSDAILFLFLPSLLEFLTDLTITDLNRLILSLQFFLDSSLHTQILKT